MVVFLIENGADIHAVSEKDMILYLKTPLFILLL